jgi:hypothetical protein
VGSAPVEAFISFMARSRLGARLPVPGGPIRQRTRHKPQADIPGDALKRAARKSTIA